MGSQNGDLVKSRKWTFFYIILFLNVFCETSTGPRYHKAMHNVNIQIMISNNKYDLQVIEP